MWRDRAIAGLMANKRAVLPGLGIKIVPFLLRLFPRAFILAAVGEFQLRIAETAAKPPREHHWPAICLQIFRKCDRTHLKLTST